jgi:hypothetical protein
MAETPPWPKWRECDCPPPVGANFVGGNSNNCKSSEEILINTPKALHMQAQGCRFDRLPWVQIQTTWSLKAVAYLIADVEPAPPFIV